MNDGLVSNNINSLCQDSLGFIWAATEEGLSKFDSKEFQNFTTDNGLAFNDVRLVVADRYDRGAVWIGYNEEGIDEFKDGKIIHFKLNVPENQESITTIYEADDSTIWCGTDSSIFLIKHNKVISNENKGEIGVVNTIDEDAEGNILVGASNGLFTYNKTSQNFTRKSDSKNDFFNDILSIYSEKNATQFFLKRNGTLIKEDGNTIISRSLKSGRNYFNISSVQSLNYLYICGNGGLLKVDKNDLNVLSGVSEQNGLQNNNVIFSMIDNAGILWIGNNNNGISKLVYQNLIKIEKNKYFHNASKGKYFTTSIIDNYSHAWFTTSVGLMEIWKDKVNNWHTFSHVISKFSLHQHPNFISYHEGKIILTYGYGSIDEYSIINTNPLSKNHSYLKLIKSTNLSSRFKFYGLYKSIEDDEGNIWASALDLGVIVLSNSNPRRVIKIYTDRDGLPDNSVRIIYEDSKQNFWFGGYAHGLTYFSRDKVMKDFGTSYNDTAVTVLKYDQSNGLPDASIRAITETSNGQLVIGTRYGGLAIMRDHKFTTLSRSSGLISNGIWDIALSENNSLWIATQDGIQKLTEDYVTSSELSEEIPNMPFFSISSRNDLLVFGSSTDIYIYEPDKTKKIIHTSIYFNKILVNGTDYPLTSKPILASDQDNITFEFTRIDNMEDKNRVYNYRMLNIEKKWNKLVDKNSVTYASLKTGKYTFQVNSFNSGDILGNVMASISFRISKPFYMKWWFLSLWFSIITISTFSLIRMKNKRKLEIQKIKIKIAEDLHDEIGSGLTKIAILSEHALIEQEEQKEGNGKILKEIENNSIFRVGKIARTLVDQMIDVIWAIDPKYDTLNDFIFNFKNFAFETCEVKNIEMNINTDNIDNVKVNSQIKRNLQLIAKEAINNAIKYSECTIIDFSLAVKNKNIYLSVKDNGKGFEKDKIIPGKGLLNIHKNTAELKGKCSIHSTPGEGTILEISFPL